jgi:hypothetical protein
MPAYLGSACIVSWIQTVGTLILTPDFRGVKYDPAVEMVEQTAGADTAKSFVTGVFSGKASMQVLQQSGSIGIATALVEGMTGTLKISPEGTAAGKQLLTIPAISDGISMNVPYNAVVEYSLSWTQNGARVDGTN